MEGGREDHLHLSIIITTVIITITIINSISGLPCVLLEYCCDDCCSGCCWGWCGWCCWLWVVLLAVGVCVLLNAAVG